MTNPLSLFMPVLPGTTLKSVIDLLNNPEVQAQIDEAVRNIGTVHFARFLLLDRSQPNFQPKLTQLNTPSDTLVIGVITEYDGDFDPYISDFVSQLGEVFDAILNLVVGGAAVVPVADHVEEFNNFITANDASQHQPNESLRAAYPQTVQQILAAFPPS